SSGVYVTGNTQGALSGQTNAGGQDAFVQKYDANGNLLWTKQFGTSALDQATGISGDSSGLYVTGFTSGALTGSNAGQEDVFLRKYDTSGNVVWTRQFGTNKSDEATAISADSSGVYIAGFTGGTLPGQSNGGGDDSF